MLESETARQATELAAELQMDVERIKMLLDSEDQAAQAEKDKQEERHNANMEGLGLGGLGLLGDAEEDLEIEGRARDPILADGGAKQQEPLAKPVADNALLAVSDSPLKDNQMYLP